MANRNQGIYEDEFVENLFNRMSKTYGLTNYISSFGFTESWRNRCVNEIAWDKNTEDGYDLMSGMGESWRLIMRQKKVKITGIDISKEMNKRAREKLLENKSWKIDLLEENILKNSIPSNSGDFIISTFGIKTFSNEKQRILAGEIFRILRKGGQLAIIEISKPKMGLLRLPYMFYLKYIIPIIGKLFMGNSQDYKMLGIYCDNFENCSKFKMFLEETGMTVKMKNYFFGCATGIIGYK